MGDHKERIIGAVERYYAGQQKKFNRGDMSIHGPKPKRKLSRDTGPTEEQEQRIVAAILDRLGLVWCHVPNGGYRGRITGARLKSQGVKRGVPDILIFCSPPSKPRAHGVAIEMKRAKGGRVSKEQKEWMKNLSDRGWICKVCNGASSAKEALIELGWLPPKKENQDNE